MAEWRAFGKGRCRRGGRRFSISSANDREKPNRAGCKAIVRKRISPGRGGVDSLRAMLSYDPFARAVRAVILSFVLAGLAVPAAQAALVHRSFEGGIHPWLDIDGDGAVDVSTSFGQIGTMDVPMSSAYSFVGLRGKGHLEFSTYNALFDLQEQRRAERHPKTPYRTVVENGGYRLVYDEDWEPYVIREREDDTGLDRLEAGRVVGEDVPLGREWGAGVGLGGAHSFNLHFPEQVDEYWRPDNFDENDEAIFGFRLLEDDGWHYGWLKIGFGPAENYIGDLDGFPTEGTPVSLFRNKPVVLEYAYETEAGVPVVAGVVPEPSVLVLVGAGALGLLLIQRRRR